MDFANRGGRPVSVEHLPNQTPAAHQPVQQGKGRRRGGLPLGRISAVVILFSATVIVAAVIALFVFGNKQSEKEFIKTDKYQAS